MEIGGKLVELTIFFVTKDQFFSKIHKTDKKILG
jgi:hypothetical protein